MSLPPDSDGVRRPLIAAAAVFGFGLAGLCAWALQAPVSSAVLAQGEIAVEGASKTVQHLEGGIVGEILVRDGQAVQMAQPLLRLDLTDARAALGALRSEHDALTARALRLEAELRAEEPDFGALVRGGPALAAAVEGERAIHAARAEERAAERAMLDGTLRRLDARRAAVEAELDSVARQGALAEEDAAAARLLAERGVTTRAALRDIERELAAVRGSESALSAQLVEATAALDEARLDRAGAETRRVSSVSEERSKVAARLEQIRPELEALAARLARSEILAPVAGTVVDLSVETVGGVIAPGEALMRIVPQGATLVVEARVLPADRERLAYGMVAEVRLPGIENRADASVVGTVTGISADRVAGSGNDGKAGEEHYRVIVAFSARPADRVSPGMPVTVVVPTEARSVIAYLLSPIRDAIALSMREI